MSLSVQQAFRRIPLDPSKVIRWYMVYGIWYMVYGIWYMVWVTACVGYSVSLSVQQAFRRIPLDPSKVIRCKSSMKYGIPNCLSRILNPFETVPSQPVKIRMT